VPIFNLDREAHRQRTTLAGRGEDQVFDNDEHLYRRIPRKWTFSGRVVPPLMIPLKLGVSVNRSKYSEPQDVLERECCDGNDRTDCVVLDIYVRDIPREITSADGRVYRFSPVHRPRETCYAHSEVWSVEVSDRSGEHVEPPKNVRDQFRALLAQRLHARPVLEFTPIELE